MDRTTNPLELRALVGSDTTEIDWEDGHRSVFPNALLRGYCPCAGCQGHGSTIRYLEGVNSVIEGIEETGSYGLTFRWGDGHSSGIYWFVYLRSLCACSVCLPGSRHGAHGELPR